MPERLAARLARAAMNGHALAVRFALLLVDLAPEPLARLLERMNPPADCRDLALAAVRERELLASAAGLDAEATLGILELDSDERIDLDGDDIDFLRSLAGLLAAALLRVRFEQTAREAAATAVTLAAEREVLHRELDHRVAN